MYSGFSYSFPKVIDGYCIVWRYSYLVEYDHVSSLGSLQRTRNVLVLLFWMLLLRLQFFFRRIYVEPPNINIIQCVTLTINWPPLLTIYILSCFSVFMIYIYISCRYKGSIIHLHCTVKEIIKFKFRIN